MGEFTHLREVCYPCRGGGFDGWGDYKGSGAPLMQPTGSNLWRATVPSIAMVETLLPPLLEQRASLPRKTPRFFPFFCSKWLPEQRLRPSWGMISPKTTFHLRTSGTHG